MLIGYVRNWPSGPKGQEIELRKAGCEIIYTDNMRPASEPLDQRPFAIKAMRPGRKLVIVEPEVFGRNAGEIMAGLQEMHAASGGGASVLVLATGEEVSWSPDAQPVVAFLDLALNGLKRRQTAAGRATAAGRGGRPPKLRGKALAAAKADWHAQNGSQAEIAERHGVSVPTLHRLFGGWIAHDGSSD